MGIANITSATRFLLLIPGTNMGKVHIVLNIEHVRLDISLLLIPGTNVVEVHIVLYVKKV